jgi:uncharacterized protein YcbK (DUF882 family)
MENSFTRRSLIKAACAVAAYSIVPAFARASIGESARNLHFYNTHTGESLKTTYWEQGVYNTEALKDIAYILRDHRTNDMHDMDPHLMDVLNRLHAKMESSKPFEIISGYRSPRTNAMLHAHSHGVAEKSLHMQGKAIDIRLGDRPLHALRNVAWSMQEGGVGYYPSSDFVHVDTGRIRHW